MEAEATAPEGSPPRVLIIDGDAGFRREVRSNCEQYGYQMSEIGRASCRERVLWYV